VSVELFVLIAGAVLIVSNRTAYVLLAYVALAATATLLIPPSALGTPLAFAVFALTTLMKVVVAPLVVVMFLRGKSGASDLRASISLPLRLLLAIVFALVAAEVGRLPALSGIPLVAPAAYVVLCGVGMLIVHRNLLAHVIGLLALGAGITLAGAVLAPGLPESVELGATFDALVGTFIGLALVRTFISRNTPLDVESLRRLRG
jgi:hydrogenase-4 component E